MNAFFLVSDSYKVVTGDVEGGKRVMKCRVEAFNRFYKVTAPRINHMLIHIFLHVSSKMCLALLLFRTLVLQCILLV